MALLAAGAAAGAQDPPQAPSPPPSFPATAEQVVVDLVVTDKNGGPVTGLARDDFVLSEDGVRQEIQSFEPFVAREVEEPDPTEVPTRGALNAPAKPPDASWPSSSTTCG